MNRTILIVICDFLLVSLLAFSAVEIQEAADRAAPVEMQTDLAADQPDSGEDLAAVMRMALEEERKQRDLLLGELDAARKTAEQRQQLLSEREQQVNSFRRELESKEDEARRLQQQRAEIQQQYATAQTNIRSLSQELRSSSTEALITKEQLAAMEAELRARAEQAEALKQHLDQLSNSNQMALAEKQRLSSQLEVAEAEKRHATQQVLTMREQIQVERDEKAKLAEGVKSLATQSGELAQEIRENRPMAPNAIFSEFAANRVQAQFAGSRPGFLGLEADKNSQTKTVLVSDGTNTVALCHVSDTPLTLWNPGADWRSLTASLNGRGAATAPIDSLSFHLSDPRVVYMPVSAEEARRLGSKVYSLSSDPFKFQDVVLVGAREGYYGECRFEIDLNTPNYVKLDRSLVKGLFGKFNPSRGDLVFSKTGQLIGIMANGEYCLTITSFEPAATLQLAQDMRYQDTGGILSQLHARLLQKPLRLQ